jgi:murein DD-endopeptidase MepM/ murein hydrolase activator NlpD
MNLYSKIMGLSLVLISLSMGINAQSSNPDTLILSATDVKIGTPDSIILNANDFGEITVPWQGKVISKFGPRRSRMHYGTDVKLLKGDTIRCAFDGIVDINKSHYGYGLLVTVNHAHQVTTYYGHLSKILVTKGQAVKAGDVIGLGGRTGRATTTHLHFELRVADKALNAQNIFDFENNKITSLAIKPHPKSTSKALASKTEAGNNKQTVEASASVLNTNSDGTLSHIIQKGDTLYKLAKSYGTTVLALCSLNGISARTTLRIGNVLKIR